MNTPCQSERAPRKTAVGRALLALSALLLLVTAAFGYVVKLKDGSLVFARTPYTVKGTRAIITLENGTVTQIPLEKIDVPGTEKYNRENFGNVIAIDTPEEKTRTLPTPPPRSERPLQDYIRQRGTRMGVATPGPAPPAAGSGEPVPDTSWQTVDPLLQAAISRVFEGAGITQYRVTPYRGRTRLLATTNSEQVVFNTLSASARALTELANRGRTASVEIVMTTSAGDPAGTFQMNTSEARLLVDGSLTVQDYFVRNVIF